MSPIRLLLGHWVIDHHGNKKPALLPPFLYTCLRFKILRVLTGLRLCGQQKGRENRHLVRERWISQQAWVTEGFQTATNHTPQITRSEQGGRHLSRAHKAPEDLEKPQRETYIQLCQRGVALYICP